MIFGFNLIVLIKLIVFEDCDINFLIFFPLFLIKFTHSIFVAFVLLLLILPIGIIFQRQLSFAFKCIEKD